MNVGVDTLPPLRADPGDRNRTSPFAFTGNRFEFRALGSGMAAADSQVALNLMLCDSLDFMATYLEKATAGDASCLNAAVEDLIRDVMDEHSAVIFNGDGYSEIWHREAVRRGLANNATTPEALPVIASPETTELYSRYNVLNRQELKARLEIHLEQYSKTISTEAHLALKMARTIIYPAGVRYLELLAQTGKRIKELGKDADTAMLDRVSDLLRKLRVASDTLEDLLQFNEQNQQKRAEYFCNKVLPVMAEIRTYADKLEDLVPEDLWPLPSYQEMLFIK